MTGVRRGGRAERDVRGGMQLAARSPTSVHNRVFPAVSQVAAQVCGSREEDASSAGALGLAEPAVLGRGAGSGHAGSLRLQPEGSENAKAPGNEGMWQVGHGGSSLRPGHRFLTSVALNTSQSPFAVGKLRHVVVPEAGCVWRMAVDVAPESAPRPRGTQAGKARKEPAASSLGGPKRFF